MGRVSARHTQRGSTLVVTLTVVTVLSLVAVAAISRGQLELEGAGTKRRYNSAVSCVDAARQLIISQLSLAGTSPTSLNVVRTVGDLTLQTGHYDAPATGSPGQVTIDAYAGNCGTGTGSTSAGSLPGATTTYNVATGVNNYVAASGGTSGGGSGGGTGSGCGVRVPVICRDGAGRQLELEFLVRVSL